MNGLKLRKIGSSVGVILPKELLEKLSLQEGDEVHVEVTDDRLSLTPYDPDFEAAMNAFAEGRREYRNALHRLAK